MDREDPAWTASDLDSNTGTHGPPLSQGTIVHQVPGYWRPRNPCDQILKKLGLPFSQFMLPPGKLHAVVLGRPQE